MVSSSKDARVPGLPINHHLNCSQGIVLITESDAWKLWRSCELLEFRNGSQGIDLIMKRIDLGAQVGSGIQTFQKL